MEYQPRPAILKPLLAMPYNSAHTAARRHAITLSLLTLGFILSNYVLYYLDNWLVLVAPRTPELVVTTIQALSWPVTLYIELIEKHWLLPIPIVGRAINYCIEIVYFFFWTTPVYALAYWLHKRVSPKLEFHV